MEIRVILFSIILSIVSYSIFAQINQFELNLGYGKTSADFHDSKFVNPIKKELQNFNRIGIICYTIPNKSLLKFKTGLAYNIRGESKNNLKYLRAPVGLDLELGNKVYFLIGGGIILSYLISSEGIKSSDFYHSKRDFQFLAELNTGIGINLWKYYNITLGYQNNSDITKMYENKRSSPGGAKYTDNVKGRDGFFYIGIRYRLNKK